MAVATSALVEAGKKVMGCWLEQLRLQESYSPGSGGREDDWDCDS